MAKSNSNAFGKMFHYYTASQAGGIQEVTTVDSSEKGGHRRAAKGCVMVSCKLALCFSDSQDSFYLKRGRIRSERGGPYSIIISPTCDNDYVFFYYLNSVFCEQ